MKIEYTCEVCGERYPTREEADACEKRHQAQEKTEALKKKSNEAIAELFCKHVETFHELPNIEIPEEVRQKCLDDQSEELKSQIVDFIGDWVKELMITLMDEEEDDE